MSDVDPPSVLDGTSDDDHFEDHLGHTEDPAYDADQLWKRSRLGFLSGRSGTVVNLVIVVALLLVVALIVWTVRTSGKDTATDTDQTATVSTGEVTATVSANGNVAAATTVNADFQGSGGVVEAVLVKPGDKVRKGQALAKVDDDSAVQALQQARAQLASAQAGYETTTQGQTSAEQSRDAASVRQAQVSLDGARQSLHSAQQSLSLTQQQQNAIVRRAQTAVDRADDAVEQAQQQQASNPTAESQQELDQAKSTLSSARSTARAARTSRASLLLQARQQVESQRQQVAAAEASLASTRAGVQVNQQGPRDGAISSARAQIASAEVGVEEARTTLEQTTLRAPVTGTVAQVNGTVGEPSSGSGGGATTGDTTSTSTSTSTSTTSSTGFVTLTGTKSLQVTADVAEADISEVKVGEPATVTLSATGASMDGTVTAVDTIETVTNNVVEYGVTVTLSKHKGVKLGQSTQVVITTGSKQGVLRVSSTALTTIGTRTTATVREPDKSTRTVEVTTGLEGDGFTEILDGLSDGDVVFLPEQQDAGGGFTFPGGGGLGGLG